MQDQAAGSVCYDIHVCTIYEGKAISCDYDLL
jgi:hypothetical protein